MKKKYTINEIQSLKIDIIKPSIIFIKGDLGAGKTTVTKHIVNNILNKNYNIISPTYTYYNKYEDFFHFDLYRLKSYDEFFAIGGEDVLDNNEGIVIIEWPEILEKYYKPDIEIILNKTNNENERIIEIKYIK